LVVALTRRGRMGWNDAAFGALVGAFPNPVLWGCRCWWPCWGLQAAGPVIVTILVDMVLTTSLCIALSRLGGAGLVAGEGAEGVASARQAAANALKGVATNPMPWAILLGALVSALGLQFPQPLVQTVGLLADAASPVALFTIGAVLARSHMLAQVDVAHQVPWQAYVPVAAIKLLVHPVVGAAGGQRSPVRMGVAIDHFSLTALVLLAALPSASNVSLLAERYGADNGRIARIILVVHGRGVFYLFRGGGIDHLTAW
jgi:malonate transporter